MAGAIEYGSFNVPASTGNFTVSLADTGLTPKFAIFWFGNQNIFGLDNAGKGNFGMGFTDDTKEYAICNVNEDKVDNSTYTRTEAVSILMMSANSGTIDCKVTAQATCFAAGQINLNVGTAPSSTRKVFYMVVSQDSTLEAIVDTVDIPGSTGNYSYTGASFTPKLKLAFGISGVTGVPDTENKGIYNVSVAVSSSQRCAMGMVSKIDIGKSGKAASRMNEALCFDFIKKADGSTDGTVDFVSFNANGFTENVTAAPMNATGQYFILIGGADLENVDLSFQAMKTSTGIQSYDPVGFTPNAMLNFHVGETGTGTVRTESSNFFIGGGDENSEFEFGKGNSDLYGESMSSMNNDKALASYSATTGDWSLDAEADIDSFDAAGVNLNFTTASPAIRFGLLLMNFTTGAGSIELVVDDSTHGHSAENILLTQSHDLVVADTTHAHSTDNIALIQKHTLVVQDSTHAHTVDGTIILVQNWTLIVADTVHGHTVDNLALVQKGILTVFDTVHAHLSDNTVLTQKYTLVAQDSLHGHVADNIILSQSFSLVIADSLHGHTTENTVLSQKHTLVVQDTLHSHTADNLILVEAETIAIQDSTHGHLVENVVLVQKHTLVVDDCLHSHSAENIILSQSNVLVAQDTLHGHLADGDLVLSNAITLTVADSTHGHTADNIALVQKHDLIVNDALHGHVADVLSIVQKSTLIVQESYHSHIVEALTLSQKHTLVLEDALHSHTADNVILVEAETIQIQDSTHGHTVDSVVITQKHILTIQDSLHTHSVDEVILVQSHTLAIDDTLHNHLADNVELIGAVVLLVAQDSLHTHTVDNLILVEKEILTVQNSLHAHTSENLLLTLTTVAYLESTRIHVIYLGTERVFGVFKI